MKYELANNIKRLRMEKNLTQSQLAKRLGVSTSIISSYESQVRLPSIDMLIKLSFEFNVSIEYLLGINRNITLDVSDLDAEQIDSINTIIEQYKKLRK